MKVEKLSKQHLKGLWYLEQELFSNPFNEKSCLEELTEQNRLYLGLFDENNLIGYAGALITFDSADIIKIGVLKTEQGKGYGKLLLTELINCLKRLNVSEILLEVEHENFKAINLYFGAGFIEISERKNYYGVNSHAKILRLELNNEN